MIWDLETTDGEPLYVNPSDLPIAIKQTFV
jgi:hypothetical protein